MGSDPLLGVLNRGSDESAETIHLVFLACVGAHGAYAIQGFESRLGHLGLGGLEILGRPARAISQF